MSEESPRQEPASPETLDRRGGWAALALLSAVMVAQAATRARGAPLLGWSTFGVATVLLLAAASLLLGWPRPAGAAWRRLTRAELDLAPAHDRRALVVGLGLLLLVFLSGYRSFEARAYPIAHDQATFMSQVYGVHDRIVETRSPRPLLSLWSMRGGTLESASLAALLLLGDSRSSFAAANFAFFVALVVGLRALFVAHLGRAAGWGAVGLLLLARSFHLPTGGLRDIRWDAAGQATFGLFTFALALLLTAPTRARVALCFAAALLTTLTRSITGVYTLGTTGLCLIAVAGLAASGRSTARLAVRPLAALLASLVGGALLFVVVHGEAFRAYYGRLVPSVEGETRLREFALGSRLELPAFYLASLGVHAHLLLLLTLVCLVIAGARGRLRSATPAAQGLDFSLAGSLAACAAFPAVFTPLCLSAPSPVVIGVLVGPIALLAGVAFTAATTEVEGARGRRWLAAALVLAGVLHTVTRFSLPSEANHLARRERSDDVARANERLVAELGSPLRRIEWISTDEAFSWKVLYIQLHEAGRSARAVRCLAELRPGAPAATSTLDLAVAPVASEVVAVFRGADAVVLPESIGHRAGAFPLLDGLRDTEAEWRPALEREFTRIAGVASTDDTEGAHHDAMAYFVRTVDLVDSSGVRAPSLDGAPYEWPGRAPARFELVNRAAAPRAARLRLRLVPPPGSAPAQVRLEVGPQRASVACAGEAALELEVLLPPGRSEAVLTLEEGPSRDDATLSAPWRVHGLTLRDVP